MYISFYITYIVSSSSRATLQCPKSGLHAVGPTTNSPDNQVMLFRECFVPLWTEPVKHNVLSNSGHGKMAWSE